MKKTAIITLLLLSVAEAFRTGSLSAFVLSCVITQLVYGKQIYRYWYRLISK